MPRALLPILLILGSAAIPVKAQDVAPASNPDRLAALAVACVMEDAGDQASLRILGPSRLPFIRSAIVAAWQASGRQVFDAGASDVNAGALLALEVTGASTTYAGGKDNRVERVMRLSLALSVTATDGRILSDRTCEGESSDQIHRDDLDHVEDSSIPETRGDRPRKGLFSRILKPAVITAASAVGVFLFFSLRSRRADDGG